MTNKCAILVVKTLVFPVPAPREPKLVHQEFQLQLAVHLILEGNYIDLNGAFYVIWKI